MTVLYSITVCLQSPTGGVVSFGLILYTSLFAQNEQHIKKTIKKAATNNKADRH